MIHEPSRDLLKARGLSPKKSFGQNFLTDTWHLAAIADAVCAVRENEKTPIIEFGSGAGALTERLIERSDHVIGVERDRDLVPVLEARFADSSLRVIEGNAGTFDPTSVVGDTRFSLCGNLPYHMTSTICFGARDRASQLCSVVFLVQKEVGERIVAKPGSKKYSVLSVLLQSVFDAEYLFTVPKGCFWPPPKVDGGVFRLVPKKTPLVRADDKDFVTLVKKAFTSRRKTLRNTLKGHVDSAGFLAAGVDEKARAETLSVEAFVALQKVATGLAHVPTESERDKRRSEKTAKSLENNKANPDA